MLLHVIAILQPSRNPLRLPLEMGIGKSPELRVGDEVLVDTKVVDANPMPRNLILRKLRRTHTEDRRELQNVASRNPRQKFTTHK